MIGTFTPLTARQQAILDFMRRFLREHGVAPSYREIGAAMGGIAVTAVMGHLEALERKGAIRRAALFRGWIPTAEAGCCPCCGRAMD